MKRKESKGRTLSALFSFSLIEKGYRLFYRFYERESPYRA